MTVLLLGPQRFTPSIREAVAELAPSGPVATITAGWREREPQDAELDDLLGGRTLNLALHTRWLDVLESDAEYAEADRRRRQVLDDLQALYRVRLDAALRAVAAIRATSVGAAAKEAALDDALDAVRELDTAHLARVDAVHAELHDALRPEERAVIAGHRERVARTLASAAAVAIAGGHVDVLATVLHLFNVGPSLRARPVLAWSAGAMAITERIVTYADDAADGRPYAEVLDRGVGLCKGVVALPHARRRLRLSDPDRVTTLARRFEPHVCTVLEDGAVLWCGDGANGPPEGAPVLRADGSVAPWAPLDAGARA